MQSTVQYPTAYMPCSAEFLLEKRVVICFFNEMAFYKSIYARDPNYGAHGEGAMNWSENEF